jgi:carbamoyl-phosphate synthase large subunit
MALGEKIKPFTEYQAGKLFIRYAWDLVVDVSKFQQFSAFGQL